MTSKSVNHSTATLEILRPAAQQIIARMGTAANLISFLCEAMDDVASHCAADHMKMKNTHFSLMQIVTCIALPWSTQEEKNWESVIVDGLWEIWDGSGDQGYHDYLQEIVFAYSKQFEDGYPTSQIFRKSADGMAVLLGLYPVFKDLTDSNPRK